MPTPVWPAGLPQRPQRQGYDEKPVSQTIGSPVDRGAAKQRRRFTGRVARLALPFKMTTAQLRETFEPFFYETLGGGSLAFAIPDPDDPDEPPATFLVRFPPGAEPYSKRPMGTAPGRWLVTLTLERIPG